MIDVPETRHRQPERGRVTAQGRRIDDGSACTLLVVNEADRSWSFHGCELVFAVSRAVRLDLQPGESPTHPDQICPACLRTVDAQ